MSDKENTPRGLSRSEWFHYHGSLSTYLISKWPDWKRKIAGMSDEEAKKVRRYL